MSFYQSNPFPSAPTCPKCTSPMRATLTKRQAEIMRYVTDYIAENGYAPCFEEIAKRFTYSSLATVHEHLSNLERKGWIRRSFNESRAIEVLAVEELSHTPEIAVRLAALRAVNDAYAAASVDMSAEYDATMEVFLDTFDTATIGWLLDLVQWSECARRGR